MVYYTKNCIVMLRRQKLCFPTVISGASRRHIFLLAIDAVGWGHRRVADVTSLAIIQQLCMYVNVCIVSVEYCATV